MANFNKVILMGYVGNEPQIKEVKQGLKVANLSLAVTEKGYKTANGDVPDRTTWANLVVWRGLAEVVEKYVKKGSNIHIEGKLRIRQYEDENKQKRERTEVEVTDLQLLGKSE